ncbi:MAG: hypothetical protein DRJ03_29775 [Chloroflexi bacterium]|nr:MAG: hypothetical protein DRJ03_29775 [Chloroflexota bacterium]
MIGDSIGEMAADAIDEERDAEKEKKMVVDGRKTHPKFGHVCMCKCHKDGEDIREFMPCCGLYRLKYINADGALDEARLLAIYKEKGIHLWTWRDRFKNWIRLSWVGRLHDRLLRRRFRKFVFPIVRRVYPNLNADEIVGVQPMTNTPLGGAYERMSPPKIVDAPVGLAGRIEDSYMREDGVRVINDFKLVSVSLVDEDQLVDPHCRIRNEEK